MKAVKNHYLDEETTVEAFTADLIRFVRKPSPAYSKMPALLQLFFAKPFSR